jgi:hypothetical protein
LVPYAINTAYAPLASTGAAIFVNFTGQHRCFVDDPLVPRLQPHHEGLIVVTNKDKYATMEMKGRRAISINNALPIVSLSRINKDRRAFGVISLSTDDPTHPATPEQIAALVEKGDVRAEINSLGEGAIWVCDDGTQDQSQLHAGDLVTTCTVPGYGALQLDINGEADDLVRSYTVAKLTMSCDFDPPMVEVTRPVVDEFGNKVLGANGAMMWETVTNTVVERVVAEDGTETETVTETVAMEPAYDMRYIAAVAGTDQVEFILKEEYERRKATIASGARLWRVAFLGCTYHCG